MSTYTYTFPLPLECVSPSHGNENEFSPLERNGNFSPPEIPCLIVFVHVNYFVTTPRLEKGATLLLYLTFPNANRLGFVSLGPFHCAYIHFCVCMYFLYDCILHSCVGL